MSKDASSISCRNGRGSVNVMLKEEAATTVADVIFPKDPIPLGSVLLSPDDAYPTYLGPFDFGNFDSVS